MKLWRTKPAPLALLAALLLTLFSGCGGSGIYNDIASISSSAAAAPAHRTELAADEMAVVAETPAGEEGSVTGGALAPSLDLPDSAGRKIIWTVNMSLETLEFDSAISGLRDAVQAAGGYIESSSVNGQSLESHSSRRYGSITARIPQEKLDSFLGAVSSVCNVVSTDRESEDITLQYTDIEARKRSLEVEQQRLLELLGQADDMETIVALESRLSEIRYQLDGYSSSLRTYDSLVDYSTVYMDLREVVRVSEPAPVTLTERMRSGLSETWRDLYENAQDLLVWVVVNFPYLLIWAAIITAFVLLLRRASRKRAARPAPPPVHRYPIPPHPPAAPKAGPDAAQEKPGPQDKDSQD